MGGSEELSGGTADPSVMVIIWVGLQGQGAHPARGATNMGRNHLKQSCVPRALKKFLSYRLVMPHLRRKVETHTRFMSKVGHPKIT